MYEEWCEGIGECKELRCEEPGESCMKNDTGGQVTACVKNSARG